VTPLSRPPVDDENDRRQALAARYARRLHGLPLALPAERQHARYVYHLYVVRTACRGALARCLRQRGIQTSVHYPVPSHRQPAVQSLEAPALPETDRLVQELLSLPLSPNNTEGEIDEVASVVRGFVVE
jgi:dTDP-4-amino-4,6-dideoxygalactose transaminase